MCGPENLIVAAITYELCVNCDVHGHVLRLSYNLPVLFSYCNSYFVRDVHGEFALINVHLFDILLAMSSRKSGIFSAWRMLTLHLMCSFCLC